MSGGMSIRCRICKAHEIKTRYCFITPPQSTIKEEVLLEELITMIIKEELKTITKELRKETKHGNRNGLFISPKIVFTTAILYKDQKRTSMKTKNKVACLPSHLLPFFPNVGYHMTKDIT